MENNFDEKQLLVTSKKISEDALVIEIIDEDSAELAGMVILELKKHIKKIDDIFNPIIKAAKETKQKAEITRKEAVSKRERFAKKPEEAKGVVSKKLAIYLEAEKERIRKENEKRQQALIDKQESMKLDEAAELEENGMNNEAEKVIGESIITPVFKQVAPKIAGITTKDKWTYEITDVDKIPRKYMIPDHQTFKEMAKTEKEKASVEGVRFFNDPIAY